MESLIYPVYILDRVVEEIFSQCRMAKPNETLGRLLGYRKIWEEINYIKIVDWVSGKLENSHTFAKLTLDGIRECEIYIDEKYGQANHQPHEIGIFHSHPFGGNPFFSGTDFDTFLNFPYNKEGNVFILIDPISYYFKVFIAAKDKDDKIELRQVKWVIYRPEIKKQSYMKAIMLIIAFFILDIRHSRKKI